MENDWVANIDILPFNAIYVDGEVKKQWAGGGIERLQTRLNQVLSLDNNNTGNAFRRS